MNTNTSTAAGSQTDDEQAGHDGLHDTARDDSGLARRELERPRHDRMVAGVCAGIAGYFDVDVTIVRIVVAALTVAGGAGLAIYLAGWLLIPEEGASQSIAGEFIGPAGR